MTLRTFVYDEYVYLGDNEYLKNKLLSYDLTYNNTDGFEDVIFMKIGFVNDIEVYLQLNVITGRFRTILIYDYLKYDLDYIARICGKIQGELLDCKCTDYHLDIFKTYYDVQDGIDERLNKLKNKLRINGVYVNDDDLLHISNLEKSRYTAYINVYEAEYKLEKARRNLEQVEQTLKNYNIDVNILDTPDLQKVKSNMVYRDDNYYDTNILTNNFKNSINFTTNFDIDVIVGFDRGRKYRLELYPNYLNNLRTEIKNPSFEIYKVKNIFP